MAFDDDLRPALDLDLDDPLIGTASSAGAPQHLSPSAASTYEQCPRRWRLRYLDRLPDPPGAAALAGTFAHRVLELLLQEPAASRTVDTARRLARRAWPETEADPHYVALGLDDAGARDFRWKAWLAVEGLWKLEDPTRVEVHATEQRVETTVGSVPFRGVIDRLEVEAGGLAVSDYKSGRAPSPRFAAERLSQVLLYAAAVESWLGSRPTRVRLLYLGQRTVEAEVTEERLADAVGALEQTWSALHRDLGRHDLGAADAFAPRPGPLCAWCPFADRCPEGAAEVARRAEQAAWHDPVPLAGV